MKKQLLIAAVAATMATASMADIFITGDAHMRFASVENGVQDRGDKNTLDQRIRLKVVGTSGGVKVVLGLRTDDDGRDSSRAGRGEDEASGLDVDYRFLTTKIGGVTIKVGDWWETTGLGLVRKGQKSGANAIRLSTAIAGIDLAIQNNLGNGAGYRDSTVYDIDVAASHSLVLNAATTIAGIAVGVEHNTADNKGYTDITFKGKVGPINFALENYYSDATAADANLIHLFTKVSGITYHFAYAAWDADTDNARASNNKFSPLGVSILGSSNGTNGNLALGNVNDRSMGADDSDKVTAVRADFTMASMDIQVVAGNLKLGNIDKFFSDIIITRSLGNNASLKLSAGEYNSLTSMGAKISVKF